MTPGFDFSPVLGVCERGHLRETASAGFPRDEPTEKRLCETRARWSWACRSPSQRAPSSQGPDRWDVSGSGDADGSGGMVGKLFRERVSGTTTILSSCSVALVALPKEKMSSRSVGKFAGGVTFRFRGVRQRPKWSLLVWVVPCFRLVLVHDRPLEILHDVKILILGPCYPFGFPFLRSG